MINGYLRYYASELTAKILPVHEEARLILSETKYPTGLDSIEVRRRWDDLHAYLFDLKEIYELCRYAWKTDGSVYLSTATARRLESLTVDNFKRDWKSYCNALVNEHTLQKKRLSARLEAFEQDTADSAVMLAFFFVFSFLISLFS